MEDVGDDTSDEIRWMKCDEMRRDENEIMICLLFQPYVQITQHG